ncbi:PDR/VanB family oxidoreductase [Gottfriedia luciferensis]|uniref:PDR/VanB family oxidoreductase n=1 Tax=Gottfriedia luciferensis TaxID=178774 RepID=UPI000B440BB1|nr:PDR/VanB family oxidoreductase [Gottfriedia luciferensis]
MVENTIQVRVSEIKQLTPNVKEFTLFPTDSFLLPAFSGGSHINTYVDDGIHTICRPYSLVDYSSRDNTYKIAIQLSSDSKGGSQFWHSQIKKGDPLRISYPKNHFPMSSRAKHHVFYAAGIGITPFLSMMKELKNNNKSYELHYTCATKESCAFYEYLFKNFKNETSFYFTKEVNSNRISVESLLNHSIGTHIYFCGPNRFISQFNEAAYAFGYPKSSVHLELFKPQLTPNSRPFEVKLANGKTKQVPVDKTLLEVLLDEGLKVPYSCRVGRCGTCEINVIDGQVEHHDYLLDEEQRKSNKMILTCVSRAKSNQIVLEV